MSVEADRPVDHAVAGERPDEPWARGLRTLLAVSQHISSSADLTSFFGALTRTIAQLTGAGRAAFCALQGDGTLSVQPDAHGLTEDALARAKGIPCRPDGDGVPDDIVYRGRVWRSREDGDARAHWLDVFGARECVAVPWRAGEQRLGLLGVYDSVRPGGFNDADVWVARIAALAAGLVWQERQAARRLVEVERQQSATLRELAERASALEKAKTHILNLAGHELRGPLAVIRGYLSLLQDGSIAGPQEIGRLLPVLTAKTDQMAMLIDEMLETSRMEEGRVQLRMERLDLREVVVEVAGAAAARTGQGQWLELRQEEAPVLVSGDRARLASMVSNLLDNAIKYSPGGGAIDCSVVIEKAAAIVRVTDRGIGIAEKDLPSLFTRFGRIINSDNSHISGTGLGLYLCRELALMHGGDIAVESEPGRGSTFSLVLPSIPLDPERARLGVWARPLDEGPGYDVVRFGLSDMIRCSAALRQLGMMADGFEDAITRMVRHLYDRLREGEEGERATVLVRAFRALPVGRLGPEYREAALQMGGAGTGPGTLCLHLVASAGDRPEWNDPRDSRRHRVIPLRSSGRSMPMIAQLVRDLGLHPNRTRNPELFLDVLERTCNVFHVPEALDSPYVPDQEPFVRPFGVRSVLGFGGLLAPHDLYVIILFSKLPISRGSALLFRAISHSVKLALQAFVVEAGGPRSGVPATWPTPGHGPGGGPALDKEPAPG